MRVNIPKTQRWENRESTIRKIRDHSLIGKRGHTQNELTRMMSKFTNAPWRKAGNERSKRPGGQKLCTKRIEWIMQKSMSTWGSDAGMQRSGSRWKVSLNVSWIWGGKRGGHGVGRVKELSDHLENLVDAGRKETFELENSRYGTLPNLCTRKWCAPVDRGNDKWEACIGCGLYAIKSRRMQALSDS